MTVAAKKATFSANVNTLREGLGDCPSLKSAIVRLVAPEDVVVSDDQVRDFSDWTQWGQWGQAQ